MDYRRVLVASLATTLIGCVPIAVDVSPETPNGAVLSGSSSTAGLVSDLAGDEAALYALALNAGVWKSENGRAWIPLSGSPRYASTLAVDPIDPGHLAVGEREGEATPVQLNRTGVWESFDAGKTWNLTFSPLSRSGCSPGGRQAIAEVAFTPTGTLLVASACGIGRKPNGGAAFDFSPTPAGVSRIGAFAVSRVADTAGNPTTQLWAIAPAAANTLILFSADDGQSWNVLTVPALVDGYGIDFARGDANTLAAFGRTAVVSFRPSAASSQDVWKSGDGGDNFLTLLYVPQAAPAFVQALRDWGDGTGYGGRKRLREFLLAPTGVPQVGDGQRIFYFAGQDVLTAKRVDDTGSLVWDRYAATTKGASPNDAIHVDIWDAHLSPDSRTFRLATDGGVFQRRPSGQWVMHNSNLHTQHIHGAVALPVPDGPFPRLAMTTSDNNEWFRDALPSPGQGRHWKTYNAFGDADATFADQGLPDVALLTRYDNGVIYTDFDRGALAGAAVGPNVWFRPLCTPVPQECHFDCLTPRPDACALHHDFHLQTFALIQTPANEQAAPLLDVVMLAGPPIYVWDSIEQVAIPLNAGRLANVVSATGGPLLLRNRRFLAHPDAVSPLTGWQLVADDVPLGTRAVWVSGGHLNPVYYVHAVTALTNAVYRRDSTQGTWQQLLGIGAAPLTAQGEYGPIQHGPVFVDPYNPDRVFVITDQGVMVSPANTVVGESTRFEKDEVLTALLTESGTYALNQVYRGSNFAGVPTISRAGERFVLSDMAFDRDHPGLVLAASPVSGLFVARNDQRQWRDLTQVLPKPLTQPASVSIASGAAFVAFEGRGLWQITGFTEGKLACTFKRTIRGSPGVAMLEAADHVPLAGATVTVLIVEAGTERATTAVTDAAGTVKVQDATGKILHLSFAGNERIAPCHVALEP